MFLKTTSAGYTRYGAQYANGPFLLLWCGKPADRDMRACVRSVRLRQRGHWMMGVITLGGRRTSLSGSYGDDGMPLQAPVGEYAPGEPYGEGGMYAGGTRNYIPHLPLAVWNTLMPVPRELQDAFWAGGGHNGAGAEAPDMRAWALENLQALRRAGQVRK